MTRRFVYRLSPLLIVPVGLLAGISLERTTSIGSTAIQSHMLMKESVCDTARMSELDETYCDLRRRIKLKQMLVAELLAGRATLAEVTAQFLALNQSRDESMAVIRLLYPGATDAEKTARNVVVYAALEIEQDCPIQRAMVLARLELELQKLVAYESVARTHSH